MLKTQINTIFVLRIFLIISFVVNCLSQFSCLNHKSGIANLIYHYIFITYFSLVCTCIIYHYIFFTYFLLVCNCIFVLSLENTMNLGYVNFINIIIINYYY